MSVLAWKGPVRYVACDTLIESRDDYIRARHWRPLRSEEAPGQQLMRAYHVELSYPAIRLGQWRLIGRIETEGFVSARRARESVLVPTWSAALECRSAHPEGVSP